MTKMEELKELKADYDQKLQELGKDAVAEQIKSLFDTYPDLVAVRWNQYTPFWNDGDPCEFGLNAVYFKTTTAIEKGELDEEDEDDFQYISWREESPLHSALSMFERSRDEDAYQIAFGDGVRVTATRDGVEVEDYDHE